VQQCHFSDDELGLIALSTFNPANLYSFSITTHRHGVHAKSNNQNELFFNSKGQTVLLNIDTQELVTDPDYRNSVFEVIKINFIDPAASCDNNRIAIK
jgi:hypothetical protein